MGHSAPIAIARARVRSFACARPFARALTLALALIAGLPSTAYANEQASRSSAEMDAGGEMVLRALALLGVPYRYGGDSPDSGFDCSGLVRYVVGDTLGHTLPRRSSDISAHGDQIERAALLPGDLVFFNTLRSAFSHVGIYVGDSRFIHAPTTGGVVRLESINVGYWSRRYDGARRVALVAGGADGSQWASRPASAAMDLQAALRLQGQIFRDLFLN